MTMFRSDGRWNGRSKELHWINWGAKCACRCARCDAVCKPIKSREWSWTYYRNRYRENDSQLPSGAEFDEYFCRRCHLTIQRWEQIRRKCMEIDTLIKQIAKETRRNGADQDNRTASPVSR